MIANNIDNGTDVDSTALPTRDQQRAAGQILREKCPRRSHAGWAASQDRRSPLAILEASNQGRFEHLLPIRFGRMLQSPFTFFRGAAAIMAADLATTPTTGIQVQACGDCHLLNFGMFATPERKVVFDINDFDETLPAPWEWDIKRLAASFVIASRNNQHRENEARDAVLACVRSYRDSMAEFSEMRALDIWYAHLDIDTVIGHIRDEVTAKRARKRLEKARTRDVVEEDFPQLVSIEGGKPRIRDNPPLIYHLQPEDEAAFRSDARSAFADYRLSLSEDRRILLDRYRVEDLAMKVVGVGSVGTYCAILLLMAGDDDPLFLQIKEARTSVLEPYAGKSQYENRGQRVVTGQRLMQSASDMFLGWTTNDEGRHFYVRQLRDMKIKPLVELYTPDVMAGYAEYCGWVLARAHARSGQPALLAGYLGKGEVFDEAIADFAVAYADQNERDHAELKRAASNGEIEVYLER